MESPAPLLQRYNIFGPKARSVKNDGALLAYIQKGGFSASFFRKTGTKKLPQHYGMIYFCVILRLKGQTRYLTLYF